MNRWQQAGNRGDVPGFMSIYTPDYVAVGRMHYQLSRAALSQMMVITIQKTKYRIVAQISQLRVQANRAEALMMKHETMTWPDPKDGKMLRGARHELCRDTWIRTKAGWKIQHSQILSSHLDKVLPVAAKATRH